MPGGKKNKPENFMPVARAIYWTMAGLISVSPRRRPSQSIRDLEVNSDIIFLLNQAKSRESGLAFGAMVGRAAGTSKLLI